MNYSVNPIRIGSEFYYQQTDKCQSLAAKLFESGLEDWKQAHYFISPFSYLAKGRMSENTERGLRELSVDKEDKEISTQFIQTN